MLDKPLGRMRLGPTLGRWIKAAQWSGPYLFWFVRLAGFPLKEVCALERISAMFCQIYLCASGYLLAGRYENSYGVRGILGG